MTAQQLKNAILQEAIEGRLIPQDPNDEPASILLERIRAEKERLVKEGKLKKKDLEVKPISEDEIPFEIPEGWMWVRLGDIASYITDGEHKTPRRITNYCGYYLLSARNVFNGYINLENVDYVDKEEYENISKHCNPHFGDVLISCSGSVGRTAVVKDNNNYVMVRSAAVISPMYTYSDYLMYTLQSTELQSQIEESSKQTAQANLFQGAIKSLKIPLPPLAEQERIVAKIEELLPKVEKYGKAQDELNKLNEELPERLKKSILQEAIEGRLVPQDPNDEPASILQEKIREAKKQLVKAGKLKKKDLEEKPISEDEIPFEIPDTWEWVRVGHIYQTSSGGTPEKGHPEYYDGNIPWVKVGDLIDIYIDRTEDRITEKGLNNSSAKLFPKDTILVAMYCNDAIGKSSILTIPMTTNQAICGLFPNTHIFKEYVYYAIQANRKILQEQSAGGAQKNINQKIVNDLLIPLPPLAEQKRIVAKIEQLLGEIDKLKK